MPIETTPRRTRINLANTGDRPVRTVTLTRHSWTLAQIILTGLLMTYLVGWVQDLERIHNLKADLSPPTKVIITKYEAWDRIYHLHGR